MKNKTLPLKELSIGQIYNGEKATYEVPIYQRNYAWEKDEIFALIQDVYDAFTSKKPTYYIGTLVSYHKGEQIYEIIDGQQRLTTINLTLHALNIKLQNKLTYRARKKSDITINSIPDFNIDEKDYGIINGFKFAQNAIKEIIPDEKLDDFKSYFQENVHIIHYQVPKDIDLNHYFEIMNSRGEQLEKHEIIKARLIEKLTEDSDKEKFNRIWENCSDMSVYIQQKYRDEVIFGKNLHDFIISDFDDLPQKGEKSEKIKIIELLNNKIEDDKGKEQERPDTFQPIIDFSNFLLIVLKLTLMDDSNFNPANFVLDDKELIREFDNIDNKIDETFAKQFGFNLLKAKYLLDNYIVHHSNEEDSIDNNPWKLQYWQKEGKNEYLKNLDGESMEQIKLVQLLSMFEVSFTAKQRKNYLFYSMLYLFNNDYKDIGKYHKFVSSLADKFFRDVYLVKENLNTINTPVPGSFDAAILSQNKLNMNINNKEIDFNGVYGDGTEKSKGIPLFIFNYLDYKLWKKYFDELRGKKTKEESVDRILFFDSLGCNDFGLKLFEQFYFSRTRRSLEHFYPRSNATGENGALTIEQINCFGNYAMIGSEANSSGSNWSPKTKLDHYLDASGKIKQVSVASIKFMIMMQICKDNQYNDREPGQEWNFEDIKEHQQKMIEIFKEE